MTHQEKLSRLKKLLTKVSPRGDLESMVKKIPGPEALGREADAAMVTARLGLDKLAKGQDAKVTPEERSGVEAIILPRLRPVVFVRNNAYDPLQHELWTHLNGDAIKKRLNPKLASIGRIELPNSSLPYGGTGFVVGANLIMTNRHVARLFADGVGDRRIVYRSGDAAIDFLKEKDTSVDDRTAVFQVRKVVMIHPYWDMALLLVDGLGEGHSPLVLSVCSPEELNEREVAAVGYPALDPRNDRAVQNRVFGGVFEVKRFQPGLARGTRVVSSFDNDVNALTHDSSTLGGNSGSAVIEIETGNVIGLHFAGQYLDANFAVPTYELARDSRVVDAGVNFAKPLPAATSSWNRAWTQNAGGEQHQQAPIRIPSGSTTWTIPIQVTISIGQPTTSGGATIAQVGVAPGIEARAMQVPKMYPNLKARAGYQADFLDLANGETIPLPELTAKGKKVAAELDDDEYELRYHHYSVVMHKKRRLAMFTASNVDWRRDAREVDGDVPSRRQLTEIPENFAEEWATDRRISLEHQLPDVFFTKDRAAWDKGHLVRRDDVCWGDEEFSGARKFKDIQKANGDTYHTTNCSPQVAGFNQSSKGEDNWGRLENMVQAETKAEKVIVFSGPVLADDDREFQGRDLNGEVWVQIPSRFWKVIVANGDDGPRAYGFVLEQDFTGVRWTDEELVVPAGWRQYMKPIAEIEELLFGVAKLPWLKAHDGIATEEGVRMAGRVRSA